MRKDFVPLLFAGDINVYSVARAFHEMYGIKSYVFGKAESGPCVESKIINYSSNPKADEQDTFMELLLEFSKRHEDVMILLIGCGDNYVRLISKNLDRMPQNVVAPYIDLELMDRLIHKEKFYELCERNGVPYPDTFVHAKDMGGGYTLPFDGPFIIKPSNGIEYWKHPFFNQKKVFKVDTKEEVDSILEDIYAAGYEDTNIIQNFIPGDDTYMRVLTSYSDRFGEVKLTCMGHVLLEEHTPRGIGNHAVIITEQEREVEERFEKLLNVLGYVGYANFDIKYDRRDGKFKVFEINTRQGRSNFYVTGVGENIAKYLVTDLIDNIPLEFKSVDEEYLWSVVPQKVAFDYIPQEEYKLRMRKLISEGKYVNPLLYKKDNALKRRLRLRKSLMSHHVKFKKYYGKKHDG